ncbi:divalent cation transporter [Candidatus Methanoplasma termitum]|uniref:Divalent cation transporter n=1 Tax=Candidatus Methanoplasma termitum TaxID=1577791 RepID=A0A0A7LC66_9ARCH|nr:magnesium transporter [Candidatus Methanoplasma termitum]AIZ56785.1 divalent cation transporter [Candidatus Methanoplasma termitum]MCL2333920.1 magnesium transporter [Candidatus Methanoplasma sp.]
MSSSKIVSGFFGRNRAVFVMGLTALAIAATADLFAGMLLGSMETYILLIPGMMVLVYSAIGMRGNIFGAMGSRLGTSMHMGTFKMSFKKGSILRANIESSIGLSFLISLAMGLIGWAIVVLFNFGEIHIASFVFISMLGGLMAGIILLGVNLTIARTGFKRDWDVDNITAPLIAAAGDIVTMPMLFICAWFVVHCPDQNIINILTLLLILATVVFLVIIFTRKIVLGRMDEAKRIISQSAPILVMCLMLDIAAGIIIEHRTPELLVLPVLVILMPAFLNEGNALSGMLTSRLSSMLHLGTLEVSRFPGKRAYENFLITYVLAAVTYGYIGVISFIAAMAMGGTGDISFIKLMGVILLSGMLTATILNFLSYYVAVTAVRFNLDPDDHSIPMTSSTMDLVGAAVLINIIVLLIL